MGIRILSQYGEEALYSCNLFEMAPPISSGPSIPIMPDSHEGPNLDRRWKEDASSHPSRRLD